MDSKKDSDIAGSSASGEQEDSDEDSDIMYLSKELDFLLDSKV